MATGPKAEIRLYDSNLFKLYYITNLYRRKISTFFLSKDEILVKKTPTSLHEKEVDSMTSVDSNFNFLCGRPHGTGPPSPPSTCVHLSLAPSPLRVDVINVWPITTSDCTCS